MQDNLSLSESLHPIEVTRGDTINEYLLLSIDKEIDDGGAPFDLSNPDNVTKVEMWIFKDRDDNTKPFLILSSDNFSYPEDPQEEDYILVANSMQVFKYQSGQWDLITVFYSSEVPEESNQGDYYYNTSNGNLFKYDAEWLPIDYDTVQPNQNALFFISDAIAGESEQQTRNILNIRVEMNETVNWIQRVYYYNIKFFSNNNTERYSYIKGVLNIRNTA